VRSPAITFPRRVQFLEALRTARCEFRDRWWTEAGSNEDIGAIRLGLSRSTRGSLADRSSFRTRTDRSQGTFVDTDNAWPRPGRGVTERADCPRRRRVRDGCLSTDPSRRYRDADTDCPWSPTRLWPVRGHGELADTVSWRTR